MKALKFLGNRVEDAANAFIDVLKYSDQSVDYLDFKDIEPWPGDIVNMFKDALKDKPFSEISAILMYTQQSSRFEPIAELMLGIGLVEMRHYDKTKLVIRHLDDNPLNNHVDSLRWGTQKQNMEDARKNGKLRGSSCKASRAKLSKKDLILIFKLKAKGLYYKDIAKRLGVSVGTIGRVINKKSYRDENIDRKR